MAFKLKNLGNVKLLSLFYIFYNFSPYSVLAVIYFFQITHSYALALSIFSAAQISQGIFEIPLGYYSDKYGRSNCLRVGAISSLLAITIYAFSRNYILLLIGAVLEGVSFAAFSGNNDALLYETLASVNQKEEYHHEYGKMNSWLELSGFLGTLAGSALAIKSLSLVYPVGIVPKLIAVLISFGFCDPQKTSKDTKGVVVHFKSAWMMFKNNIKVRLVSMTDIIGYVGGVTWNLQSAFYNLFLPTWATSMVMSINFFTSFVSFRVAGGLIQKYKALKVLFYSEIYSRALTLLAFIFPTIASPFMIATASVTYGPTTVAKSTILQNEFTDEQRATMTSINSFVGNIIYSVSAMVVGAGADKFGVTKALLAVHLLMVSVGVIYWKLKNIAK